MILEQVARAVNNHLVISKLSHKILSLLETIRRQDQVIADLETYVESLKLKIEHDKYK